MWMWSKTTLVLYFIRLESTVASQYPCSSLFSVVLCQRVKMRPCWWWPAAGCFQWVSQSKTRGDSRGGVL